MSVLAYELTVWSYHACPRKHCRFYSDTLQKKERMEKKAVIIQFFFWFEVDRILRQRKFSLARNSDFFLTFYMVCKQENTSEGR